MGSLGHASLALSVVIPSKDRHQKLAQTLAGLQSGSVKPEEIIVVDDYSHHEISCSFLRELFPTQFTSTILIVRHREPLGAAAARNTGAALASGDILLFLDDDTVPTRELVRFHVEHHEKVGGNRSLAMGSLRLRDDLQARASNVWLENSGDFREISGLKPSDKPGGLVSANFSITRELFGRMGGFDEGFPFNRNEDTEFGVRARMDFDAEINFIPEALAKHDSDLNLDDLMQTAFKGGISKAYWSLKMPDATGFFVMCSTVGYVWRQHRALERALDLWVNRNRKIANSRHLRRSVRSKFESELPRIREIYTLLGVAQGWSLFSPGARYALERPTGYGGAGALFRSGISLFKPALFHLVGQELRESNFKNAEFLLDLLGENAWAQLARLLASHLQGYQPSDNEIESFYARAGSGVPEHERQLQLAERIQSLSTDTADSQLESIYATLFQRRENFVKSYCTQLLSGSWLTRARRATHVSAGTLDRTVAELDKYRWHGSEVFAAQRMRFFADNLTGRYSVLIADKQGPKSQIDVDADIGFQYSALPDPELGLKLSQLWNEDAPLVRLGKADIWEC